MDPVTLLSPSGATYTTTDPVELNNLVYGQGYTYAPVPAPAAEDAGYDDMSVEQLRGELAERGLPKSGNKAELVLRLQADDKENARPADAEGVDGTEHS